MPIPPLFMKMKRQSATGAACLISGLFGDSREFLEANVAERNGIAVVLEAQIAPPEAGTEFIVVPEVDVLNHDAV